MEILYKRFRGESMESIQEKARAFKRLEGQGQPHANPNPKFKVYSSLPQP